MLKKLTLRCIDTNNQYCPCLLADTNHCLSCSLLKGEEMCNCEWTGMCLYYEKHWQKKRLGSEDTPAQIRIEQETNFILKNQLSKNTYLISFDVSDDFAQELTQTGAFVFLRHPADPQFFCFPIGIMKVEKNTIDVVIEVLGPKTKKLFDNDNRKLYVRGPYYNGVFGQPWIDTLSNGRVVLVTGGMGQPPAVPIVKTLVKNNNKVDAILAPGKIGTIFIAEELEALGITLHSVFSMRRSGIELLVEKYIKADPKPDLIVSAGPDEQHYGIITAMHNAGVDIPMAATNNSLMCCGEGICGSCQRETKDGSLVRACKAQLDFSQFLI